MNAPWFNGDDNRDSLSAHGPHVSEPERVTCAVCRVEIYGRSIVSFHTTYCEACWRVAMDRRREQNELDRLEASR